MSLKADLKYFTVPQIMFLLVKYKKTGKIEVKSDEYGEGEIYFDNGECVHAKVKDKEGLDALYEISIWDEGELSFIPDEKSDKKTIEGEASVLFEQIEKRTYEIANFKEKLPPLDSVVHKSPYVDMDKVILRKNDLKILSLVDGKRTLRDIIKSSGLGALDAYISLAYLFEKGFLVNIESIKMELEKIVKYLNTYIEEMGATEEIRKDLFDFVKSVLTDIDLEGVFALFISEKEGKFILNEDIDYLRIKIPVLRGLMEVLKERLFRKASELWGKLLARKKMEKVESEA